MRIQYIFLFILLFFTGCANMGPGPMGGAKDVTPPSFVKSTPAPNSINFKGNRLELEFNEYLQINNPAKNIVVSPPQKRSVSAKALGKKVIVEFKDSIKENTTYTIDFGNSIGDYTENNPISGYRFSFSSGDKIDSLEISGTVLNANNLTPAEGIIVGIYSSDVDTLFSSQPFERVGKTDAAGRFHILGAANKQYYIYALGDLNGNFYYDQPGESFGVQEAALPLPSITTLLSYDTVYKDSVTIDTIITRKQTKYEPDSVLLRICQKKIALQELEKVTRPDRKYIQFIFKKEENSLPKVSLVDSDISDWYLIERNAMADTIKYWITDTTILKKDTIQLAVQYLKTDKEENLVEQIDTIITELSFNYLKEEEKKAKSEELLNKKLEKRGWTKKRTNIVGIQKFQNIIEVYNDLTVTFERPIKSLNTEGIHIYLKKDTNKVDIPHTVEATSNSRKFLIKANIKNGESYTLKIDSASVFDYYDNHNDESTNHFSRKEESDYGSILLKITNADSPAIVQLINSSDETIRELVLTNNEAKFIHISKGIYYARLIIDSNGDGQWTTGSFEEKRQPEKVYYFNKSLKVREGWDLEEDWNVTATAIDKQRPSGIQASNDNKKKR